MVFYQSVIAGENQAEGFINLNIDHSIQILDIESLGYV